MSDRELVAIDGFVIDATLSEGHSHPSKVTQFPVEKGIDVSDNIRPEPIKITLECVVSDTPLGRVAQARGSRISFGGVDPDPPSKQAYDHLISIRDAREPVLVQTSLRDFPSMALDDVSVPRKSGEPDAIHFTASFTQIAVVENVRRSVQIAQAKTSLGSRSPGVKFIQIMVWRRGRPPGSFNIVENQYVLFGQKPNGKWGYFHSYGSPHMGAKLAKSVQAGDELSASDYADFEKDFNRDHWEADANGGMYATWAQRQTNSALVPPQNPTTRDQHKYIPYRRFK